jgi:hypothetical protein
MYQDNPTTTAFSGRSSHHISLSLPSTAYLGYSALLANEGTRALDG